MKLPRNAYPGYSDDPAFHLRKQNKQENRMKEYLIFYGVWHIAQPGIMSTRGHYNIDGHKIGEEDATLRLAWFTRDKEFICFDYNNPEVKKLDEE